MSSRPALRLRTSETLREYHDRVGHLAQSLRELARLATALTKTADELAILLHLSLSNNSRVELNILQQLARTVGKLRKVPSSWDGSRRKTLVTVFSQLAETINATRAIRSDLAARLSQRAFAAENSAHVFRVLRFRFVLLRLWPGWWSARRQALNWYLLVRPATQSLFHDFEQLAAVHRVHAHSSQLQAEFASEVLFDAQGTADWEATLAGLRTVEDADGICTLPAELRAELESQSLNRDALAAKTDSLAAALAAFDAQIGVVRADYELPDNAELLSRIADHLQIVEREADTTRTMCSMLRPECDVPLSALPATVRAMCEWHTVQGEIAKATQRLPILIPVEKAAEAAERDWSAEAQHAAALLRYLDQSTEPLPPAEIRALTDPDLRSSLTTVIGCGNRSSKISAGEFAGSGRPIGYETEAAKLNGCWRR